MNDPDFQPTSIQDARHPIYREALQISIKTMKSCLGNDNSEQLGSQLVTYADYDAGALIFCGSKLHLYQPRKATREHHCRFLSG